MGSWTTPMHSRMCGSSSPLMPFMLITRIPVHVPRAPQGGRELHTYGPPHPPTIIGPNMVVRGGMVDKHMENTNALSHVW